MKIKTPTFMAVGLTKYVLCILTLTIVAAPLTVHAQTSSPAPNTELKEKGPFSRLGLTDAQKAKIKEIRLNTRTQIENVLTPEQKEKLKAAYQARREQGQGTGQRLGKRQRQGGLASLNLTDDQKAKIRQIRESSKQQIEAVLTPEQQAQLRQLQENWKARRQQRNSQ
ncbi:hypothetical protein B6N60_02638 [Richelia sinica FACHB-800]|uniref:P pilus assembly/Cpx signaling pathway, periplasmic inhibitor/zinc-resistance associated protein n=1 Tax=Richelia sinica FACHB-800 TaxID=1357546 RepID=A0A975T9P0_9NOST|nr:P pilus assembly/Cpx signaling pathway, periplasmic inhibitor/zinc-resistance associated protein [Richelia sinica]MBD2665952.1 P pilus assembly/Cpx signaling pathway, periplasmic inhibitor/zinc-resistance associated protein [Richelia sinica FACHB-800]QXE23936.1 hypothetical protein B6N60_02638 [Richelia sinica FACHB-800]